MFDLYYYVLNTAQTLDSVNGSIFLENVFASTDCYIPSTLKYSEKACIRQGMPYQYINNINEAMASTLTDSDKFELQYWIDIAISTAFAVIVGYLAYRQSLSLNRKNYYENGASLAIRSTIILFRNSFQNGKLFNVFAVEYFADILCIGIPIFDRSIQLFPA